MRVLHNFAKYGCFTSINDKIINNLLQWGRFQQSFRRPLAEKLWMGPKNIWDLKWLHGPPLSPFKIWWKSRDARWRERMKCDVFIFITGRICRTQLCRYCFYSRANFWGFFGDFLGDFWHVEPIQVKFSKEERTVGPLLPAKFHLDRFRGGGLRPPKLIKIGILSI